MAAKNNQSGLAFGLSLVIVVIVSIVVGYVLAGTGKSAPAPAPQRVAQTTTDANADGAQKPTDPNAVIAQGGDYTAPGAPKIEIHEVKPPRLTDQTHTTKPAPKPVDSEASQEGSTGNGNPDTPPPPDNTDLTSPVTGDTTASTSGSTDPDYESVGSDATQQQNDDNTQSGSGGPYHVQVGSFAYARNAKVLADALRNRGYTTTTVEERQGDKVIYHVQTGAFRSQKAADKSSQDLKNQGFPAFTKQNQ